MYTGGIEGEGPTPQQLAATPAGLVACPRTRTVREADHLVRELHCRLRADTA
jgi:hypothetical protein